MKKTWKIVLIILAIIGLAILIFFLSKPREMNKFIFPENLVVNNYTTYEIDTVVKVLVNKIFNYDSVVIEIFYLNSNIFDTPDLKLEAFILQTDFDKRHFLLFINRSANNLNEVLSHESIHFDQYMKGELVVNQDKKLAVYKGDTILFTKVPYNDRPFEKYAFEKQYKILKELNTLLYK